MIRGPKPRPRAAGGTPPRGLGATAGLPRCPDHLSDVARKEWRRLARPLHDLGVLTTVDRAALAAYCQAYGRWVEAERKLAETPLLLKMPSGYIQQSPWLSISNKQLELMGRYMTELGMTPSSRVRLGTEAPTGDPVAEPIEVFIIEPDGSRSRLSHGAADRDTAQDAAFDRRNRITRGKAAVETES